MLKATREVLVGLRNYATGEIVETHEARAKTLLKEGLVVAVAAPPAETATIKAQSETADIKPKAQTRKARKEAE